MEEILQFVVEQQVLVELEEQELKKLSALLDFQEQLIEEAVAVEVNRMDQMDNHIHKYEYHAQYTKKSIKLIAIKN